MDARDRTVRRIRHEPKFRIAEVVATERVTPRMMRVMLGSPEFADFRSDGFDDHVRLFFPDGGDLPRAAFGPNGLVFPPGAARPKARDYTPRFFDSAANRLAIDFVLHGAGPGSTWAANAKPGDRIGIAGPRSSFVPEGDFDWHVLIGDETALPAIGRRIEELPSGARVVAFIEIADSAERQSFATGTSLDLTWIERDATAETLLDAVRAAPLPPGDGYAFVACEDAAARALRRLLVEDRKLDPAFVKVYRYWLRGAPDLGQSDVD